MAYRVGNKISEFTIWSLVFRVPISIFNFSISRSQKISVPCKVFSICGFVIFHLDATSPFVGVNLEITVRDIMPIEKSESQAKNELFGKGRDVREPG